MSMTNEVRHIQHWIQDEDVEPVEKKYFEKRSPANGAPLCMVARGTKADAEMAIQAACQAFAAWAALTPIARGNILRKAAQILQERKSVIAERIALDGGLSRKQSMGEVDSLCEHIFFWASEGRRLYGKTMSSKVEHRLVYTVREPLGVVVSIVPGNSPFGGRSIMPALLCGNTVIMKPSEDTPSAGMELAYALREAGLPKGVFSVVHGFGKEIGASLVQDERVQAISFTGSATVGKDLEKSVAQRASQFVKVTLELGGKNGFLILDDANIDLAVKSALSSAYSFAGQRCSAASRIIVMDRVYEKVRKKLLEKIPLLKIGLQDTDDLGPLLSMRQIERIEEMMRDTAAQGIHPLCGGKRITGEGYELGNFFEPTLFEVDSMRYPISREEIFGPVATLHRARDVQDAIALLNDSSFGLTASVYTDSLHRAEQCIRGLQVGVVHVNGNSYGSEPHMPFGGGRNSGNGTREAGTEALENYTQWKTVTITHNPMTE